MNPGHHADGAAALPATASAVAGKTLRTFARTPQLVGATLGQGILFLLVFRYVFGGAIDTGDLSYIAFMTPGILTAGILFAAAGAAVGVAQDRATGFADRVLSLPTSRTGLVLGRVAADTAVVIVAALAMSLVAALVGFRPQAGAPQLLAAAGLVVLYALAFAALFGALGAAADGPQTAQSFGFLAIPLTFVSSAYVPTETMPRLLAVVADNQPVTHMVDALRQLAHAHVLPHDAGTLVLATSWAATITLAALLVARRRLVTRR